MMSPRVALPVACWMTVGLFAPNALAKDTPSQTVELADGKLTFEAPAEWKSVKPRSRILERELSVAPPEGSDAPAARLTVMAAGGSIDANLARWTGQFSGTEAGADRPQSKTEKIEVDGMPTTLFDHAGTYLESAGGPFGPKTPRPDYRMIGAVVETGAAGNYFFKLVGPQEAVDPAAKGFRKMIETLRKP